MRHGRAQTALGVFSAEDDVPVVVDGHVHVIGCEVRMAGEN